MKHKRILMIATMVVMLATGTAFAYKWHHRAPHFGLFTPKMVAQLHLNSAQAQALDNIHAKRKTLFTQFRDQHKARMESMEAALKSDNPDLRSLARQADTAMDQMREQTRKIRDDELNLYDSLTPQQKAVVRTALLKRLSFMQKHQAWRRGYSGHGTD